MLVKKPFGVGYTLNLANWRSWIVLAVVGALVWQESKGGSEPEPGEGSAEEPVEVLVEED